MNMSIIILSEFHLLAENCSCVMIINYLIIFNVLIYVMLQMVVAKMKSDPEVCVFSFF